MIFFFYETGVIAQQLKVQTRMLVGTSSKSLGCLTSDVALYWGSGKAADDGLSTWAPTPRERPEKSSWLWPESGPVTAAIWWSSGSLCNTAFQVNTKIIN